MRELKSFLCLVLLLSVLTALFSEVPAAAAVKSDTQPPEPPLGLAVTNKTFTSISLSWTSSSDDTKVKGYEVYRDGKKIIKTSKTAYTNSDLIPGRKYTYSIRAYDAAGNVSAAGPAIDAAPDPDNQAPSVPGNLSLSSPGYTSITVSWSSSTDNTSVKRYEIYRNGRKAASTSATSYTVKGLVPGTVYSFFVKACDIAGNYSAQSSSIPGTTLPDTSPPGKPSGLKASAVSETEITLMWSPSSDNVKVKGYEIFCDGEKAGTTSRTVYSRKNLIPGKSHAFYLKAMDMTGNKSESSETVSVVTLRDVKKPSAPSGLKAKSVKASSVSLEWNASADNTRVAGYVVYCNGIELANTRKTSKTVKSPFGLGVDAYWVKAYDLAGNFSDASNRITVIIP